MKITKKNSVVLVLVAFVILGIAATTKPDDRFKNLKILHNDINHEDLGKLMHSFNDALGVKCNFCHAPSKEDEKKMDFASDENPEKLIARKMMKMTNKINKKFFHAKDRLGDPNAMLEVNCKTCHHGEPHPEIKSEEEEKGVKQ
jgi:hypothetical protein